MLSGGELIELLDDARDGRGRGGRRKCKGRLRHDCCSRVRQTCASFLPRGIYTSSGLFIAWWNKTPVGCREKRGLPSGISGLAMARTWDSIQSKKNDQSTCEFLGYIYDSPHANSPQYSKVFLDPSPASFTTLLTSLRTRWGCRWSLARGPPGRYSGPVQRQKSDKTEAITCIYLRKRSM